MRGNRFGMFILSCGHKNDRSIAVTEIRWDLQSWKKESCLFCHPSVIMRSICLPLLIYFRGDMCIRLFLWEVPPWSITYVFSHLWTNTYWHSCVHKKALIRHRCLFKKRNVAELYFCALVVLLCVPLHKCCERLRIEHRDELFAVRIYDFRALPLTNRLSML